MGPARLERAPLSTLSTVPPARRRNYRVTAGGKHRKPRVPSVHALRVSILQPPQWHVIILYCEESALYCEEVWPPDPSVLQRFLSLY